MDMSRPGDAIAPPRTRRARASDDAAAGIMTRLHTLLVEDDAIVPEWPAGRPGGPGPGVLATVATGAEAVSAAALHAPELTVMDLRRAPGDGAAAMRAILRGTGKPRILVTGPRQALAADAAVLPEPSGELRLVEAPEHEADGRRRHGDVALPA